MRLVSFRANIFHNCDAQILPLVKPESRLTRLIFPASPSMSLNVINNRLDLVSRFRYDNSLREHITNLLRRTHDSQRLVQKFSMGRGDAEDLISLLRTIEATKEIARILEEQTSISDTPGNPSASHSVFYQSLSKLSHRLSLAGPDALASRIFEAIDEEGLMESYRVNETESAGIISLAQGVLINEGSLDDHEALSGVIQSKIARKKSAEQDSVEQQVWVMRRR